MVEQDVTEFLREHPPAFLLRGESMAAVEDDRTLASHIAAGAAHPVDENTLHDQNAGKVDDRLHIYGWFLAGAREEAPRPIAGELVTRPTNIGRSIHAGRTS
jgi:hypothetical protein